MLLKAVHDQVGINVANIWIQSRWGFSITEKCSVAVLEIHILKFMCLISCLLVDWGRWFPSSSYSSIFEYFSSVHGFIRCAPRPLLGCTAGWRYLIISFVVMATFLEKLVIRVLLMILAYALLWCVMRNVLSVSLGYSAGEKLTHVQWTHYSQANLLPL
jgi:hypothetical protein